MSSDSIIKNHVDMPKHVGTPDDDVWLSPYDFRCHLCKNNGPTKTRKNLWQLSHHFQTVHPSQCEEEWREFISNLAKMIKWGII